MGGGEQVSTKHQNKQRCLFWITRLIFSDGTAFSLTPELTSPDVRRDRHRAVQLESKSKAEQLPHQHQ